MYQHHYEAIAWALAVGERVRLPPAARVVLLVLAHHTYQDTWTAWPGQARIAALAGVSTRHVRSLLRDLEGRALIRATHRPGSGGGRQTDAYLLLGYPQATGTAVPVAVEASGNPAQATGNLEQASGTPVPPNKQLNLSQPNHQRARKRAGGGGRENKKPNGAELAAYLDTLPASDRELVEAAIARHTPDHPLDYAQAVGERLRRERDERDQGIRRPTPQELEAGLANPGETYEQAAARIMRDRAIAARSRPKSSPG